MAGTRLPNTGLLSTLSARPAPSSKAERVQVIAELMANGEWVTGDTGPKLAELWGLSVETLKKDAAEASRGFDVSDEEKSARKARWYAKLEGVQALAMRKGRVEAAVSALKLEGDHLGVFEAQKIDLNVSGDDDALASRVAALLSGDEESEDPGEAKPAGTSTH